MHGLRDPKPLGTLRHRAFSSSSHSAAAEMDSSTGWDSYRTAPQGKRSAFVAMVFSGSFPARTRRCEAPQRQSAPLAPGNELEGTINFIIIFFSFTSFAAVGGLYVLPACLCARAARAYRCDGVFYYYLFVSRASRMCFPQRRGSFERVSYFFARSLVSEGVFTSHPTFNADC